VEFDTCCVSGFATGTGAMPSLHLAAMAYMRPGSSSWPVRASRPAALGSLRAATAARQPLRGEDTATTVEREEVHMDRIEKFQLEMAISESLAEPVDIE
jgi:hypothetical protein